MMENHLKAIGLVIFVAIFFIIAEARPDTLEKKKSKSAAKDDNRFQRQNNIGTGSHDQKSDEMDKYKMAVSQSARRPDGTFPDIEILFSDLERFNTETLDHGKQANRNGVVNFVDQPLSKGLQTTSNVESHNNDDGPFNFVLDFFWPQSKNSESMLGEKQTAKTSAVNFVVPSMLREQHSTPSVQPQKNDDEAFSLDKVLDFFWPRSKKTESVLDKKQADQYSASNIGSGKVAQLHRDEGAFFPELNDLFWPQSKRAVLVHDEKQTDRNYANNYEDKTLLRGQHAAPKVAPWDKEGGEIVVELQDLFWPQFENPELIRDKKEDGRIDRLNLSDRPSLKYQRAVPNFELNDSDNGALSLARALDFFWPQFDNTESVLDEKSADHFGKINVANQTLLRVQRASPNVEPRANDERALSLGLQDLLRSQTENEKTESLYDDEDQPDRNGGFYFADQTLWKGQDSARPRDTDEGATEPTLAPNKPADITYESNMLYYFLTITLPAFISISLAILLCCFCLRVNGACCRLFDARPPDILEEDADFAQDSRTYKKYQVV